MNPRQGGPPSSPADRTGQALAYHERSKHYYERFAASLGYMDWANQPDPFRRFDGAPRLELPFVADDDSPRRPLSPLKGTEPREAPPKRCGAER